MIRKYVHNTRLTASVLLALCIVPSANMATAKSAADTGALVEIDTAVYTTPYDMSLY